MYGFNPPTVPTREDIIATISDELYDDVRTRAYPYVRHIVREVLTHAYLMGHAREFDNDTSRNDCVGDAIECIVRLVLNSTFEQHAAHVRDYYVGSEGE